ncbi:bifunctional diguanylate cyclase/phosphodiesterase [Neptuniibacter halophilus]|uniref:bifunctional diguanylate cyclase/phosphodiesterase n=1 Tax=Neptuniibacter halophilus TaxID=651666 RepID=UPI00257332E4|nr:EAL domain-containing protein [Neptuniibacter halophilus]
MSLVNQLIGAILAILIGLVSGTLYIMSESSRSVLQDQLESHAQDSATHLGLYLAPYMAENDSATVETAVNAIFDSGFYQRIIVTNAEEGILFEKQTPPEISPDVPQWFQDLVKITPPNMFRDVTYQWRHVGKIYVQSRAGYAYEKLWKGAQDSLILFTCLSLFCLLAISTLIRYLLAPLKKVENQAVALTEKRYLEQEKLPRTRELKRVVEAMNRMVRRVHQMFEEQSRNIEELRRSAYQDNLTGLSNQRATQSQLAERLDYRQDFGTGTLLNVRLKSLQQINQQIGIEQTNSLIKTLAKQLQIMADQSDQGILGRVSGADFILLTRQSDSNQLIIALQQLDQTLSTQLNQFASDPLPSPLICAGSSHCRHDSNSSQLLSEAQIATQEAEKANQLWQQFNADEQSSNAPDQTDWQQHVAHAINQRKIFLQVQSVFSKAPSSMPIQEEVFARILNQNNQPASAGEFLSVVKELNLSAELDRAVFELGTQQASQLSCPLCINLSAESVSVADNLDWLLQQIRNSDLSEKMVFELDETSVLNHPEASSRFRKALNEQSIGFGVDHFGIHPSGFSYLYSIQPDYIKIDGSLIRNIDQSEEDRFFVSSLVSVAHSLGIKAYAEHVERESQLELLNQLEVDGSQGYLHGAPRPLNA